MTKSPQIQSRINAIAKELANGVRREDIISKYCKKFQKGARQIDNYIEKAKPIATELSNKANKHIADAREAELKEAAKNGLKSKIERLMSYQNEIEAMEDQLYGRVKFTFKLGNSIKHSHTDNLFMLPIDNQIALLHQIRSHRVEISKILGEYAPDKLDANLTHKTPVDVSKIPINELLNFAKYLKPSQAENN